MFGSGSDRGGVCDGTQHHCIVSSFDWHSCWNTCAYIDQNEKNLAGRNACYLDDCFAHKRDVECLVASMPAENQRVCRDAQLLS